MENGNEINSLILGKIGSNSSSISKTYLESSFRCVTASYFAELTSRENKKIYLDKDNRVLYDDVIPKGCKEIEILSAMPYIKTERSYGETIVYSYFVIEIIEKSILLRHLRDERMIIEENKEKNMVLDL